MFFNFPSGGQSTSFYIGNTAALESDVYINDSRVNATEGPLDVEITTSVAGIITFSMKPRGGGAGTNICRVTRILVEEV